MFMNSPSFPGFLVLGDFVLFAVKQSQPLRWSCAPAITSITWSASRVSGVTRGSVWVTSFTCLITGFYVWTITRRWCHTVNTNDTWCKFPLVWEEKEPCNQVSRQRKWWRMADLVSLWQSRSAIRQNEPLKLVLRDSGREVTVYGWSGLAWSSYVRFFISCSLGTRGVKSWWALSWRSFPVRVCYCRRPIELEDTVQATLSLSWWCVVYLANDLLPPPNLTLENWTLFRPPKIRPSRCPIPSTIECARDSYSNFKNDKWSKMKHFLWRRLLDSDLCFYNMLIKISSDTRSSRLKLFYYYLTLSAPNTPYDILLNSPKLSV